MQATRFLIPGRYTVETRIDGRRQAVSWLLTNVGVISVLSLPFLAGSAHSLVGLLASVAALALALVAWHSLYEVGYLVNDVVTSTREADPTLRWRPHEAARLRSALPWLAAAKLGLAAGAIAVIALLDVASGARLEVVSFGAGLVALAAAFTLHNLVRSRANLLTFLLLLTLKYVSIPLLVAPPDATLELVVVIAIAVPLLRTVEYATLPRFALPRLATVVQPVERFRVLYLLGALFALGLAWMLAGVATSWIGVLAVLFQLGFRVPAIVVRREGGERSGARRGPAR
jgi:hypothetical protein